MRAIADGGTRLLTLVARRACPSGGTFAAEGAPVHKTRALVVAGCCRAGVVHYLAVDTGKTFRTCAVVGVGGGVLAGTAVEAGFVGATII